MNEKHATVLIIEEEERFAKIYAKALSEQGYIPIVISSKKQLNSLTNFKPDVIIADIYGFGKRKMEVIENIRRLYSNRPVIAISSLSSIDDCIISYSLGVKNYIHKSVSVYPLLKSVQDVSLEVT